MEEFDVKFYTILKALDLVAKREELENDEHGRQQTTMEEGAHIYWLSTGH